MPTRTPALTLTMLVSPDGRCWPAGAADRRLIRQKLATRAGVPYRTLPPRADYLVALCASAGVEVIFRPVDIPPVAPLPFPALAPPSRRTSRSHR